MEIVINDALLAQAIQTFEKVAKAHYEVEAQRNKHYHEIQTQQVAQDGVQMLSDLFKQFLNQMHGSNIIDALMKFVEINPQQKQPSETKPEPQPEPRNQEGSAKPDNEGIANTEE